MRFNPPSAEIGEIAYGLVSIHDNVPRGWFRGEKTDAGMGSQGRPMSEEEELEIRRQLAELRQEHRDLDTAIAALIDSTHVDTIRIQRMKKRKLVLKDRIASLEDQLLPDIIA